MNMKNKVLVRLIVPELDTSFDVFVPINEVIWRLKILFMKSISDLSSFSLPTDVNYLLLNKDTGKIYQNNELVLNTDIRNGTELFFVARSQL